MYYIYRITNLINGKTYIGQHRYEKLDDGYMGSGVLILKAIKKHGKENFKKDIIEFDIPTLELANDWEQMYILFERAKGKAEYNIANGGNGIGTCSEKTREKLSNVLKGKPAPNKGKHPSEDTKKKMSESHKGENNNMYGKHHSKETKQKISKANKGNIMTDEQKKKLSDAHKGKHWKLVDGKRVYY